MRATHVSCVAVLVLELCAQPFFAQTDSATPCCVAVNFQTFNPLDVAIQLVSVERATPDNITVTWQILNRSKTPQQFDKMAGLAAFQLVWDAEVIDLASRTRFKVASDPKTRIPVAAKHDPPRAGQGVGLAAGRTLTTWAKFLVPANVTKVTVSLPGAAQPWENVTIAAPGSNISSVGTSPLPTPLKDLRLSPASAPGGTPVSGIVELFEAPGPQGVIVRLGVVGNPPPGPNYPVPPASVPSQVSVTQGTASAETGPLYTARFPITTQAVVYDRPVTITAQAGGQTLQATLVLQSPRIQSATLDVPNVCDNWNATIKYEFDGPIPADEPGGRTHRFGVRAYLHLTGFTDDEVSESEYLDPGDRKGSIKLHVGTCKDATGCSIRGRPEYFITGFQSGTRYDPYSMYLGGSCKAPN
jgi:hypothetical protein